MGNYGFNYGLSAFNTGAWPNASGPNSARRKGVTGPEGASQEKGERPEVEEKDKGIKGFFRGIKNGFVNTVKGLFSIKGLLITAGTVALVAATGGAALIPLAAVGMGIGGYQITKGAMAGNTEKIGEGVFTVGASVGGLKLAPRTIGNEALANGSMWGKIKAPFIGKKAFQSGDTNFWVASKDATMGTLRGWKTKLFGTKAPADTAGDDLNSRISQWSQDSQNAMREGEGDIDSRNNGYSRWDNADSDLESDDHSSMFQSALEDELGPEDSASVVAGNRQAKAEPGLLSQWKDGITKWWGRVRSGEIRESNKRWFSSVQPDPTPGSNAQSQVNNGTQVTFSERAHKYLNAVKNSPHTASSYMGTVFGGSAEGAAKAEEEAKVAEKKSESGNFYY